MCESEECSHKRLNGVLLEEFDISIPGCFFASDTGKVGGLKVFAKNLFQHKVLSLKPNKSLSINSMPPNPPGFFITGMVNEGDMCGVANSVELQKKCTGYEKDGKLLPTDRIF